MKLSEKNIIKALEKNAGIVTAAAESLGMDRSALSTRIHKSPVLEKALVEIKESMIDLAESKLLLALRNGNMTAIIFYLKTQAKSRGYVERQEITGNNGGPITWKQFIEQATDEKPTPNRK